MYLVIYIKIYIKKKLNFHGGLIAKYLLISRFLRGEERGGKYEGGFSFVEIVGAQVFSFWVGVMKGGGGG